MVDELDVFGGAGDDNVAEPPNPMPSQEYSSSIRY
jgi:hypothetical protein